ncbi:MAG: phosphoenolpyruvate carboxykinase (ATP) [Firmicutes bacterium]|nr:phosphoenolpyruvate carboxykinase (ATP) [Bacillota bacterium]
MTRIGIENLHINAKKALYNACPSELIRISLQNGEGRLTETGALAVETGKYTGRSPHDKFIVDTEGVHDLINWGKVNRPVSRDTFNAIRGEMIEYLGGKEIYVFDGFAGADRKYTRKFRVINEFAWQNLFIRNLLIRPTDKELENFGEPDYTILCAPGFKCDPEKYGLNSEAAIIIDYEAHFVIIAGTHYAGEIKKSVFSVMNFALPVEDNVLPMHCSANMGKTANDTAVFFGLSGTGKTTLSADPKRKLIGDDEHGWSCDGIFNIEGGCYAKCIDLKQSEQPEIFNAIRFGAVTENVVLDNKGTPDYEDRSLTENTRVGYPVDFISNSEIPGVGGIPKAVIFLTADAFGVLPPISRLSKNAAMYQFVTGFTSKLAGTERGVKEPQPTFSTLFGEPFMPLRAEKYAQMLGDRLDQYGTKVYLVNTGWTGGPYGKGQRMKLGYTRHMITSALSGLLDGVEYVHDDLFNLDIPKLCPGVPSNILNPRNTWANGEEYDKQALKLAKMFEDNFKAKYPNMNKEIAQAGPNSKVVSL